MVVSSYRPANVEDMREALGEAEAAVTALDQWAYFALADGELVDALACVTGLITRLTGMQAALVREAEARAIPGARGHSSAVAWLREQFRMSPATSRQLVRLGALLDSRLALQGAVASAAVSPEQALTIGATVDVLTSRVETEIVDKAEAALIDEAARFHPAALALLGERILSHVAPEIADEHLAAKLTRDERRAAAERSLTLIPEAGSSHTRLIGWLSSESAAIVWAALDPLAKPQPAVDGARDLRNAAQRRADALVDVCKLALAAGDLPLSGGERPQLTVTVKYDVLAHSVGAGILDTGQSLSAEAVRRLACDAKIIPAVLGSRGAVLDLGRSTRTWTGAARRAIVLRDGGCAFPGCDRPPKWCDVHHIKFWSTLGPTDLDNGVLLCGFHHELIHHSEWEARMSSDRLPEFIPPFVVDPLRRPLRNRYHRRP